MSTIHSSAVIHASAELADDVQIEPYAIIGPAVRIGKGSIVKSHSIIESQTTVGDGCLIGPAAYLGQDPQHLHFLRQTDRPKTWLTVGDRTIIREGAMIHRSINAGIENATRIGSDCLIMGAVHVAHDCLIANNVILANGVLLGGHVHVAERAFLGGGATLHQFTRVGRLAIISGNEAVSRDIPPFGAARYGGLKGYNAVGCRRAGLSRDAIHAIRSAFHCIHNNRTTRGIVAAIGDTVEMTPEVAELVEFISLSKRGMQMSVKFFNFQPLVDAETD